MKVAPFSVLVRNPEAVIMLSLAAMILLSVATAGDTVTPSGPVATPPTRQPVRPATQPGGWQKETIPPDRAKHLLRMIETGNDEERRDAIFELSSNSHVQAPREFREPLLRALRDPNVYVRLEAAECLFFHQGNWTTQDDAMMAMQVIIKAMGDTDVRVKTEAVKSLRRDAGPLARHAADALLKLVAEMPEPQAWDEDDPALTCWVKVHGCLRNLDPEAAVVVVPGLKQQLHSERRITAVTAHAALRRLQPDALPSPPPIARFIPEYLDKLKHGGVRQGYLAVLMLYDIGPAAAETIPEIIAFLERNEEHEAVEGEAGLPLGGLTFGFEKAAVPQLLKVMRGEHEGRARLAAEFLKAAPHSGQVIPELVELAKTKQGKARAVVVNTLAWVGRTDESVPSVLLNHLKDADAGVRIAAADGLLYHEPPQAVEMIRRLAGTDPSEEFRKRLGKSLEVLDFSQKNAAARQSEGNP
jgi:HEAT repeat protein